MASKDAKADAAKAESKAEVHLLEEDDEFEEFPKEDWGPSEEDKEDLKQWENNWDDDRKEDDFALQLRAEMQKVEASLKK